MAKYQVLHVSRYDFTDKAEGRQVRGCKVSVVGEAQNDPKSKGCPVLTFSADINLWDKFSKVPGNYELELDLKPSGSKVVTILKDANFVQ